MLSAFGFIFLFNFSAFNPPPAHSFVIPIDLSSLLFFMLLVLQYLKFPTRSLTVAITSVIATFSLPICIHAQQHERLMMSCRIHDDWIGMHFCYTGTKDERCGTWKIFWPMQCLIIINLKEAVEPPAHNQDQSQMSASRKLQL